MGKTIKREKSKQTMEMRDRANRIDQNGQRKRRTKDARNNNYQLHFNDDGND